MCLYIWKYRQRKPPHNPHRVSGKLLSAACGYRADVAPSISRYDSQLGPHELAAESEPVYRAYDPGSRSAV